MNIQHGEGNTPAEPLPTLGPLDQGMLMPEESRHLRNIRQLTFGHRAEFIDGRGAANYAEAYWSPDGRKLILQSTRNEYQCDQVFELDIVSGALRLLSSGEGRVTCSYYTADQRHIIYSSTHLNGSSDCPPRPDMSRGYVWPVYPEYDIYLARSSDGQILRNLTESAGYDAEGTIDWNSGWLYHTSKRHNDIDIYRTHMDSGEVERLTDEYGYDGGPFISYDGCTIVYRRQIFRDDAEREDYTSLLAENLVRPSRMELMVMESDGSGKRQLTSNGFANFAPFLHPDNETLIFCSNMDDPQGRDFDLYIMDIAGGEAERVTFAPEFDGFPMFSPDGRYLVWCSNRNHALPRETNVFVAEWVE
jgi:Tol biopolymer transport system component